MPNRFATKWPSPQHTRWHTPRTRRGWLITATVAAAALALKLTLGVGLILLLLRHIPH